METKEQVIEAISSHRLTHLRDRLEPLIWPSIRIHYADVQPDHYPIGASRLGGFPICRPTSHGRSGPARKALNNATIRPQARLSFWHRSTCAT